jgi:hypothetical protein
MSTPNPNTAIGTATMNRANGVLSFTGKSNAGRPSVCLRGKMLAQADENTMRVLVGWALTNR